MKKLNNHGITIIEVLITFVLVVVIIMSMYTAIFHYSEKAKIESERMRIITYKNLLTKEIQDDFIKIGVKSIKIEDNNIQADITLNDNTKRVLKISTGAYPSITYGLTGDNFTTTNAVNYKLPVLGTSNVNSTTINDLQIDKNTAYFMLSADQSLFKINIPFYHPDFANRYGIFIVIPHIL